MGATVASDRYHPDKLLFLLLIPFISAINYYLTYSNIRLNGFLALTFTIDTLQGYAAWWTVRWIIFRLDQRYPYTQGIVKRILLQLPITSVAGLLVISLLTELTSWIARGKPAPLNFYTIDLVIIGIWFFVINGIYVGLFFYAQWRDLHQRAQPLTPYILVQTGGRELRVPFEAIRGLEVEGDYVKLMTHDNKKYYVSQSLDKLEKVLPSADFFRLNRQFLLSRQVITGFKRSENGKIMVLIAAPDILPSEITVSRLKAPAFREWFRQPAASL